VAEPSKLRLLGAVADATGRPLRLRDFALAPVPATGQPRVIVVCGTSIDAGKTYTVMSVILGLRRQGCRVAGIKLTGTAAGRDTWNMLDAGACVALDFVDGGWPSTYQCTPDELQAMYRLLLSHVTAQGAEYVVVEIADGLLQKETAGLLQTSRFTSTVDAFVLAAGEPMAVAHGVQVLQTWGITPVAFSGVVSMSFLNIREAELATRIPCLTARDLQAGAWTLQMLRTAPEPAAAVG